MIRLCMFFCVSLLASGCTGGVAAPQGPALADAARGKLLYETACIGCHTAQAHWRESRLVHDWSGLLSEVARWQANAGQRWTQAEIIDTAAHLNREFYRLACPVPGCMGPERQSSLTQRAGEEAQR
jgi:hypothetical protein